MKATDAKNKILECSRELFFSNGYSKVTIDDIIKKIGVSKKTIYQHYNSKREIINDIVIKIETDMSADIDVMLRNPDLSFPEKLKNYLSAIALHISNISFEFTYDLQKYNYDIWKNWQEFKNNSVLKHFSILLEDGIKKGFIRNDLNIPVTVLTFISSIDHLFEQKKLSHLPEEFQKMIPSMPVEKFNAIISLIFNGIFTEEIKKSDIK